MTFFGYQQCRRQTVLLQTLWILVFIPRRIQPLSVASSPIPDPTSKILKRSASLRATRGHGIERAQISSTFKCSIPRASASTYARLFRNLKRRGGSGGSRSNVNWRIDCDPGFALKPGLGRLLLNTDFAAIAALNETTAFFKLSSPNSPASIHANVI